MNRLTDQQLLREYAERRSEPAFAELVRRHVDLVYSAAWRMVRDPHLAEDVAQGAFVALAKSAAQLTERAVLSGWLHRTAQNIAAQTIRTDVRRRAREQEAAAMNESFAAEPDDAWENIAPHLDDALGELSEADRDALLLRYFERKSAQEMAQVLGVSGEAAQKRVRRAVERLRECFAKRGVTAGASGLAVVLSAHAVQAAPAGLTVTISTAAALAGSGLATTAAVGNAAAMTALTKTLIAASLFAIIGVGIYEARQPSQAQARVPFRSTNTLADDAKLLASTRGKWQSDILRLKGRTGEIFEQVLVIEFSRPAPGNPASAPIAQARLSMASPTKGIPGLMEVSTAVGGSSRSVRLHEQAGVRTMTISRTVLEREDPQRTQRDIERYKKLGGYWAITFPYELNSNRLTLKGFPTTNAVGWGITEFTVPQSEITFQVVP